MKEMEEVPVFILKEIRKMLIRMREEQQTIEDGIISITKAIDIIEY